MAFCLVPKLAEKFKKAITTGEINPEKLNNMTSEERNKFFTKIVGDENATKVNAAFESKLLLKNKEQGMITWAKQLTGIKEPTRRDLVSKIERMIGDEDNRKFILNPKNEELFLKDLASTRLGVDVSPAEARRITEIAAIIDERRKVHIEDTDNIQNRVKYGESILDMNEYVASLKPARPLVEQAVNVANVPRAAMATLDFSAPFRQGFGMVTRKEFWKNLVPMFRAAFSEDSFKKIQSEIITRPNFNAMKKSGLRITGLGDKLSEREEAFMTTLLDRIPGVRGSERAYTGFLAKLRADAFDDLIRKAEMIGEDISPGGKTAKDLATVVNNFTGAGTLGQVDHVSPILNALFFSPRKLAATIQKFNPKNYLDPRISKIARKEALRNLIGMLGVSASVLSLADLAGAEVERNPRSSDFGKVKIGNTRFDVSGGDASYIVLLSRLITNQTKSTTSDIVRTLGEDFGASTRLDTAMKYLRNKLSPTASYIADFLDGEDAIGEKFDWDKAALGRMYPLIIQTAIEAYKDSPNMLVPTVMVELFGIGSQTYDNSVDWNDSTNKELIQFKEKIGQEKFEKVNEEFNDIVNVEVNELLNNKQYQNLSDEDKQKTVSQLKKNIKADMFKKNKFKPKKEKKTREQIKTDKLIKELSK